MRWKLRMASLVVAMMGFAAHTRAQEFEVLSLTDDESDFQYSSSLRLRDDCGCESDCKCGDGCDAKSNCDSCGADKGGCGCVATCFLFGPAEPIKPFAANDYRRIEVGGWFSGGYTTEGANGEGTGLFNDVPNQFVLNQAWGYVERQSDTGGAGFDWGFRMDYIYGTDGPDTQAFGSVAGDWDTTWTHGGGYGHAIPQAYGVLSYNNLNVKVGHFYTIIGYEVVQATGNFFYSHSNTMVLNEPFTHTGILADWTSDSGFVTLYGGWTQGWDTGFSDNGGSSFLGGISLALTDRMTLTWAGIFGDWGFDDQGGSDTDAVMTSIVFDWNVTDRLEYVFQADYHDNTQFLGGAGYNWAINQYLFYAINDCLKAGVRAEYDKFSGVDFNTGLPTSEFGEITAGLNWRPHANIVIRPEVRWNIYQSAINAAGTADTAIFGIDAVVTW